MYFHNRLITLALSTTHNDACFQLRSEDISSNKKNEFIEVGDLLKGKSFKSVIECHHHDTDKLSLFTSTLLLTISIGNEYYSFSIKKRKLHFRELFQFLIEKDMGLL